MNSQNIPHYKNKISILLSTCTVYYKMYMYILHVSLYYIHSTLSVNMYMYVYIAFCSSIQLWKTDGQLLCSLIGHKSQVRCCVFDQTGSFLATACLGDFSAKVHFCILHGKKVCACTCTVYTVYRHRYTCTCNT